MKYVANILAMLAIGWPSLILAYCWGAARSGFSSGLFLFQRHENTLIEKFTKNNGAGDQR